VEDKESLEPSAVVGKLADSVEDVIDDFLSDGVMSTSVVVRGILLSTDDLLGVVKLTVSTCSDLVANSRFQIDVYCAWDVFSIAGFAEEGVEGIISSTGLIGSHLTIGLDAVLKAVQLPAAVTGLDTGLAHMD